MEGDLRWLAVSRRAPFLAILVSSNGSAEELIWVIEQMTAGVTSRAGMARR